jgi:hypothetical protein
MSSYILRRNNIFTKETEKCLVKKSFIVFKIVFVHSLHNMTFSIKLYMLRLKYVDVHLSFF